MFGWLRRKLAREHRKLAYQNFDAYEAYEEARLFSTYVIRKLGWGGKLDTSEVDAALKVNMELRRLYDQFGGRARIDLSG